MLGCGRLRQRKLPDVTGRRASPVPVTVHFLRGFPGDSRNLLRLGSLSGSLESPFGSERQYSVLRPGVSSRFHGKWCSEDPSRGQGASLALSRQEGNDTACHPAASGGTGSLLSPLARWAAEGHWPFCGGYFGCAWRSWWSSRSRASPAGWPPIGTSATSSGSRTGPGESSWRDKGVGCLLEALVGSAVSA